jgi:hypothetical protein
MSALEDLTVAELAGKLRGKEISAVERRGISWRAARPTRRSALTCRSTRK